MVYSVFVNLLNRMTTIESLTKLTKNETISPFGK